MRQLAQAGATALIAMLGACGGAEVHHHHHEGHRDRHHHDIHGHDHPFTRGTQTVGEGTSGLVLRSVRHAPHETFHRLVFDVSRPSAPAERIPRATATGTEGDLQIDVRVWGIDRDVSGHELRAPVVVQRAPVAHFVRLDRDGAGASAYRVQLTRRARFRLHALESPVRIVLDVEKIDLER